MSEAKLIERIELDERICSYSALVQDDQKFPIILLPCHEGQDECRLNAVQALKLLEVLAQHKARFEVMAEDGKDS